MRKLAALPLAVSLAFVCAPVRADFDGLPGGAVGYLTVNGVRCFNCNLTLGMLGGVGSSRSIAAGAGLAGGGDLSANRTISIAAGGITAAMLADSAVTTNKLAPGAVTSDKIAATAVVGALGYPPAWTGTVLTAGAGLTGGGDLSAGRTFSIASGGVTAAMLASGVAVANLGYTPAWSGIYLNAGSGLTGGGDLSAGRTFSVASGGVTGAMLAAGAVIANLGYTPPHRTCLDFDSFGAVTGSATSANMTANGTAWNNVMTAIGTSNGCVVFGPGTYEFSSQVGKTLASQQNIMIYGAGKDVTILDWPSGGGIVINRDYQSTITVANLTLTTGVAGGGVALGIGDARSDHNASAKSQSSIFNVAIRGSDGIGQTDYWNTGIYAQDINLLNVYGVDIFGESTHSLATGMVFRGVNPTNPTVSAAGAVLAVVNNITSCYFQSLAVGYVMGASAQGVTITQTNFNADTVGITTESDAWGLDELIVTDSQFNTSGDQIYLPTLITDVAVIGNYMFLPPGKNGVHSLAGIVGGLFSQNMIQNDPNTNAGGTGNGIAIEGNALGASQLIVGTGNVFNKITNGFYFNGASGVTNIQSNVYASGVAHVGYHTNKATDCPSCVIGGGSD